MADREWKDLTTAETKALWNATKKPSEFAALLIAKFKEKNNDSTNTNEELRTPD